jgi:hypothetical protein
MGRSLMRYQIGDGLAVHRHRERLAVGHSTYDLGVIVAELRLLDRLAHASI